MVIAFLENQKYRTLLTISAAGLALLLFELPALAQTESLQFNIDTLRWSKIFDNKAADGDHIQEYVPSGQTLDNWTEMATLQDFPSLKSKSDSRQFMQALESRLKDSSPSLQSQVIDMPGKNPDKDLMFEWTIGSGKDAQHELDRIVTGNDGLHVLHYCVGR